jgi:hypothetical protein
MQICMVDQAEVEAMRARKSRKKSVLVGFKPTKNRPKPTKMVELPEIMTLYGYSEQ